MFAVHATVDDAALAVLVDVDGNVLMHSVRHLVRVVERLCDTGCFLGHRLGIDRLDELLSFD